MCVFFSLENGVLQQQFDYSEEDEREFSAIASDPTGQNVVVGSYDRLDAYLKEIFNYSFSEFVFFHGRPAEVLGMKERLWTSRISTL